MDTDFPRSSRYTHIYWMHSTLGAGSGDWQRLQVGQALAGDQCAFEFLVNRYHQPLVSYIRGFLKDNDQIYDVLQHVYLQLYLSLPILLRNVSLKAWLFQVARNHCLDELRKRRRRAEVPFSTLEREDGEEELSPLFAALAESARLARIIPCVAVRQSWSEPPLDVDVHVQPGTLCG